MGAEQVQSALGKIPGQYAAAYAVIVHQQVDGEIFYVERRIVLERLLVKRMQHRVAGTVGGSAGALGGAFAVVRGHAAERPLVDLAVVGARERHPVVLELDHRGDGLATHVLDGVLVAQPVRALDRVVHVPAPVVLAHVAQRRTDAALRRNRVAACRKDFRYTGRREAGFLSLAGGLADFAHLVDVALVGEIRVGEAMAVPLIKEVKKKAWQRDLVIIDAPPGTSCPVIASIGHANALLIVTEPTVSGIHDMERVGQLAAHFKIPAMICINKYDLNPDQAQAIEAIAEKRNMAFMGKLPFDPAFTKAMVQGKSIMETHADSPAATQIKKIWNRIMEHPAMKMDRLC